MTSAPPPKKPLHIVIAGGSLSALLTAIPLRKLGHNITILERSPIALLHDQGAGVVAGGDTLAWVQRHGKSKRTADDISVLSQQRLYLDKEGNVIDQQNSHQRMTSWGVLYGIGRECFDGIDYPDAGEAKYEYGRTVTSVKDLGSQVEVHYEQARSDASTSQEGESSIKGDFLIVADGPSSHLRTLLLGDSAPKRSYTGYVAFRGTIPESQLSPGARAVFIEKFSFFHGVNPNTQILAYTIPNSSGSLEPGERLVNWVWYHNVASDSSEYNEIMTDSSGKTHRFTLPAGGHIASQVWDRQTKLAKETLPPQFAELVSKSEQPFVQAITDLPPPKEKSQVRALGGKAVIVGDALSGFRPHTAASTSQAAFHALRLEDVFEGEMSWDGYEEVVFEYAVNLQAHGVRLGERSQFGRHPLAR